MCVCVWGGCGFIQEASMQSHLPLNCAQSNKAAGEGAGGGGGGGCWLFVVYSLM